MSTLSGEKGRDDLLLQTRFAYVFKSSSSKNVSVVLRTNHFIVAFLAGYCTRYNIAQSSLYAHYTCVPTTVYLMYIYTYIQNYRKDGREKSDGDH